MTLLEVLIFHGLRAFFMELQEWLASWYIVRYFKWRYTQIALHNAQESENVPIQKDLFAKEALLRAEVQSLRGKS